MQHGESKHWKQACTRTRWTYNFCFAHHELYKPQHVGYICTPAMAAGLTDHLWNIQEVLTYKNAPAPGLTPSGCGGLEKMCKLRAYFPNDREDDFNATRHQFSIVFKESFPLAAKQPSKIKSLFLDAIGVRLDHADLTRAKLQHIKMPHASLKNVNFTSANLYGADLRGSDCSESMLYGAKLEWALLPS